MNRKIVSLFLPILQIVTGFLATIEFFILIYNNGSIKSIFLALAIALIGFWLGFRGIIVYKKNE